MILNAYNQWTNIWYSFKICGNAELSTLYLIPVKETNFCKILKRPLRYYQLTSRNENKKIGSDSSDQLVLISPLVIGLLMIFFVSDWATNTLRRHDQIRQSNVRAVNLKAWKLNYWSTKPVLNNKLTVRLIKS